MKLIVVFLLCFLAATYQQHLGNYHFYEPRLAFYYPGIDDEANYFSFISSRTGDFPDAAARVPVSRFGNGNYNMPQSRFFGINYFISQLLNNNKIQLHIFPTITSTSTVTQTSILTVTTSSTSILTVTTAQITFTSTILQTVSSMLTTPFVKLCVPLFQFSFNSNVYCTQPCSPRKRRVINIREIDGMSIVTNPVQPLETTVEPVVMSSLRDRRNADQPEIASSQQDLSRSDEKSFNYRQKRLIVVVSTTVTVTSWSFVASTSIKTTTLTKSDGSLKCLPSGYNVCSP